MRKKIVSLSFLGEEASFDEEGEKCYREGRETEAVVAAIPEGYTKEEAFRLYLYTAIEPVDPHGYMCANHAEVLEVDPGYV